MRSRVPSLATNWVRGSFRSFNRGGWTVRASDVVLAEVVDAAVMASAAVFGAQGATAAIMLRPTNSVPGGNAACTGCRPSLQRAGQRSRPPAIMPPRSVSAA